MFIFNHFDFYGAIMFEYVVKNFGNKSSSLVIFLHGYNGCVEDHAYALDWLKQYLPNSLLIVPIAPEICDKNPDKKQWFGMKKYDPENIRFDEKISAEDIFEIYSRTQPEISKRAAEINEFISEVQKKYNVDSENVFLIGFSQGAMLALYSALKSKKNLGGVFALSGLIAGAQKLSEKIIGVSPIYLFHGMEDHKVQYKTLALTEKWFDERKINYEAFVYEHLAHKICEDEVIKISQIIQNKSTHK